MNRAKHRVDGAPHVPVAPGDLAGLDALPTEVEALGLFCWSDVRPLKGVAGFVDWRLGGALSRALEQGLFSGTAGEVMLVPSRGRLGKRRIFLFGLGAGAALQTDDLRGQCLHAVEVMRRAGVDCFVLGAPELPARPGVEREFLWAVEAALAGQVAQVLVHELLDAA